jgi:hypothetical protein
MALGLLLASSGVAVLAAASPAAADKTAVKVCHATDSDKNPYQLIVVDDDSTDFHGHLDHRNEPNKTWKKAGSWSGIPHAAGDPKPDLIEGLDGTLDEDCQIVPEPEPTLATGSVSFTDPTCDAPDAAGVQVTEEENATHQIAGTAGPGATVTVTFTANDGAEFAGGEKTKVVEHTFPSLDDCEQVEPPAVVPPTFAEGDCNTDPQVNLPEAPFTYVVEGEVAPGSTVTVTAKDVETDEVVGTWEHTFDEVTDCESVLPPTVNPPKVNPPKSSPPAVSPPAAAPPQVAPPAAPAPQAGTVIPSSVHAGTSGLGLMADSRGQSGLALVATGALILLAGLGIGLTRRDGEA